MKIIEEILDTLDFQTYIRDIRQGPFQTAVLTRQCGLASTPRDTGPHHDKNPVKNAGRLLEQSTESLARLALSESETEAAIGMATINSLIEVNESRCKEINAAELLMAEGEGKLVAIIGHFPFVPGLRNVTGELYVIEKNPRENDLGEAEAENILPRAEVVGITGTAFTNHTIENLLNLCRTEAYIVVLGGTAPLSPVLFDHGIAAVAGTLVTDPEVVLRGVSQGSTYRQLKGIRRIAMKKDSGLSR
jgi:uncharacterized protein (DUF4213/DUF364 family)